MFWLLPGISSYEDRYEFSGFVISAAEEINYIAGIDTFLLTEEVTKVNSDDFDPITVALYHVWHEDIDEASWLLYLAAYFGKHDIYGWNLFKGVYGALNNEKQWTWMNASNDVEGFQKWLKNKQPLLKKKGEFDIQTKHTVLDRAKALVVGRDIAS